MFKVLCQTCVLNTSVSIDAVFIFLLFHLIGPQIITKSLGAPK